jgi:hypothetical protein
MSLVDAGFKWNLKKQKWNYLVIRQHIWNIQFTLRTLCITVDYKLTETKSLNLNQTKISKKN